MRYCLISSNASWQALSQINETPFFISLVKGWQHLDRFDMNLRMYASHPCNPLSSLRFLRGCIFWMAQTFSRSRWIPLDLNGFLWMSQWIQGICHWILSGRIWLGSSSIDASADVKYSLQIRNTIAFSTALYCNIVYVKFYGLVYMLVKDCIHCS